MKDSKDKINSSKLELSDPRNEAPDIDAFLKLHRSVELLRRKSVAKYWKELNSTDPIPQLTPKQRHMLFAVAEREPCSLQVVMEETDLSKSAASTAIEKLVRINLIRRTRNDSDKRKLYLVLTPEIRSHFRNIDSEFRKRLSYFFKNYSKNELDLYNKFNEKIFNDIK